MSDNQIATSGTSLLARRPHSVISAHELGSSIVGFQSRDIRARPFFLLRAQLSRLASQGVRRIGVTSPLPQVGKTFVACNLAAAASRLPDLTCHLIDLDLRRGSVAETFGLPSGPGVVEYLRGEVGDFASLSWGVEDQGLIIYPTVGKMMRSSEILARQSYGNLIAAFDGNASNDIGIFDLPPAFANDDAILGIEQLDGYLLVVQDGVTTAKQVKDAIRLLGPEKLLGTVLNRYVRGLTVDDYGYGYGNEKKFSKYYSD
jgi:protein-tyrosine kinase